MATPVDVGTAFLEAIREIAGLLKEWIAGADMRRMKVAVQQGESYIRLASPIIKEKLPVSDKDRRELEALEKSFFKYN